MRKPSFAVFLPVLLMAGLTFCSQLFATEPIPLRAGQLTMVFDADNAFLRYIQAGPHEVLRGVNAPIRNDTWGTVQPRVSQIQLDDKGNEFQLSFNVHCQAADVDFRWRGVITGNSRGEVEFAFDGEAFSTFKRNRIGFCVLHPAKVAGKPWTIETTDGTRSNGRFPLHISPHQPARNLRAVEHRVAPGLRARVEFQGDVFEMEDQRNWTDASFKTYCTPLELPYPVVVEKGTRISQRVRFRIQGEPPQPSIPPDSPVTLTLRRQRSDLPQLGLQLSSEVDGLTVTQITRLRALHLDHLRVHLNLSAPEFVRELRRATEQAKALGTSLHLGLNLGDQPGWARLLAEVGELHPPASLWLVLGGEPNHFSAARERLQPILNNVPIGVGRDSNFVDLNRERPDDGDIEVVSFAINPQIHAVDSLSIMETLPIHAETIRSAREFLGDRPLAVGPITLRPQTGGPPLPGQLPPDVDVRQPGLFTAAWTVGSIQYLAEAGASSATFYETVGWKGIIDAEQTAQRAASFPSRPDGLFDVYHVLRDIGEFSGGKVQRADASDPLKVAGLVLRKSGQMRVLVANLTDSIQTVVIRGLGRPAELRQLDTSSARTGRDNPESYPRQPAERVRLELPVTLQPYAVARIDRATN